MRMILINLAIGKFDLFDLKNQSKWIKSIKEVSLS